MFYNLDTEIYHVLTHADKKIFQFSLPDHYSKFNLQGFHFSHK